MFLYVLCLLVFGIPSLRAMELAYAIEEEHLTLSDLPFTIQKYTREIPQERESLLVADIGGTTSDFGIFVLEDTAPKLLFSLHTNTPSIHSFPSLVAAIISYAKSAHSLSFKNACFGAPGKATENKDYAAVRKYFTIKSQELIDQCDLEAVLVVNDFFIIGPGIELIAPHTILSLHDGKPKEKGIRVIIGAGSGLGTSYLTWDSKAQIYTSHPSEAGAMSFSPKDALEISLGEYIKEKYGFSACWGNLLSGNGVLYIYHWLKKQKSYEDTLKRDLNDPKEVFAHGEDELCKTTISLFFKFYGRYAQTCALLLLPEGGVYITGNIAAKNSDCLKEPFLLGYRDCCHPVYEGMIKSVPLYLITDPNVSLYGAAQYLQYELTSK